jgi:alkaline phosphatase D
LPNGNVPNPHTKFIDLDRHGGYILNVDSSRAQADFYFMDTHLAPSDSSYFETGMYVLEGTHLLNASGTKYPAMANPPIPAPLQPRAHLIGLEENTITEIDLTLYPNPAKDVLNIECEDFAKEPLSIKIYDLSGKVHAYMHLKNFSGAYMLRLNDLPSGSYFISFERECETHIRKIQVVR